MCNVIVFYVKVYAIIGRYFRIVENGDLTIALISQTTHNEDLSQFENLRQRGSYYSCVSISSLLLPLLSPLLVRAHHQWQIDIYTARNSPTTEQLLSRERTSCNVVASPADSPWKSLLSFLRARPFLRTSRAASFEGTPEIARRP